MKLSLVISKDNEQILAQFQQLKVTEKLFIGLCLQRAKEKDSICNL